MQVLVTHWAADEYGWTVNEFGVSTDPAVGVAIDAYPLLFLEKGPNFVIPLLM